MSTTVKPKDKYSLVIKARSKVTARKAARERGITLELVDEPYKGEVIAAATVRLATLQRWFNEDVHQEPPFEEGSLLLFQKVVKL